MAKKVKAKAKTKPKARATSKMVVKLKAKKPAAKKAIANGLPKPSSKPFGQAGKAEMPASAWPLRRRRPRSDGGPRPA